MNPFRTRCVRPGQLDYVVAGDRPINRRLLFDGLDQHGAVAIVGPHGTGKTTLLKWWWRQRADSVRWVTLSSGKCVGPATVAPSIPPAFDSRSGIRVGDAIARFRRRCVAAAGLTRSISRTRHPTWIVDGWEQVPAVFQWMIRWRLSRRSIRLVVTSHRDHRGIETIHRTAVDAAVTRHLVEQCLQDQACRDEGIDQRAGDAVRRWAERKIEEAAITDVREFLFDLYDVYASAATRSDFSGIARAVRSRTAASHG